MVYLASLVSLKLLLIIVVKYNVYVVEMIPIDPRFTERCTAFEHAATYDYARRVVENKKEKKSV